MNLRSIGLIERQEVASRELLRQGAAAALDVAGRHKLKQRPENAPIVDARMSQKR